MDYRIKNEVAQHVTEVLMRSSWPMAGDENVHSVEVSRISNLVLQVRVVTQNEGVHYFTVKVSENY